MHPTTKRPTYCNKYNKKHYHVVKFVFVFHIFTINYTKLQVYNIQFYVLIFLCVIEDRMLLRHVLTKWTGLKFVKYASYSKFYMLQYTSLWHNSRKFLWLFRELIIYTLPAYIHISFLTNETACAKTSHCAKSDTLITSKYKEKKLVKSEIY